MIDITSAEANYLRENGRGNDVHMSSRNKSSHGKKYFATTDYKTLRLLNEYRNTRIIETHDGR